MNVQIMAKPYTGLKQVFFETGHLWAVEEFFNTVTGNRFTAYDKFAEMVMSWGLRASPNDLMEYFLNEVGEA